MFQHKKTQESICSVPPRIKKRGGGGGGGGGVGIEHLEVVYACVNTVPPFPPFGGNTDLQCSIYIHKILSKDIDS